MKNIATRQLTREKLLDEGVARIIEHGYHGSGLQEILQSVGVPKGSFYNYFASKETFGAEVIRHYIEPFIRQLDYWLKCEPNGAAALRAYFRELIDESARRQFKGGCLLGNLMGEIGDTSEICRISLSEAVQCYRDKLREGIARAQQQGCFRQDLGAAEMADLLVNAWQGALLRMKIEQSVQPLEDCCSHLLEGYFKN
ncbi:TetR family transcriptional regulator [Candidatus Methylospira mobilis]|uniref:TetR family transcriptional regulator n=1 Tax=Candidatus Methylospira mobilis TaxID=1808979 RepID=A0A5Q0BKH4_9GAMM|nr:TetR/AcrR family transcriptional regulator [Candidatus Methylospira mobilis]QFY44280.1 TetR family transcriptional regulator [Candidatus Methylospira mobilis]WNV06296.1 TetR family transcriptional regulator C-terminal domain-containing protein [Candidatus Methylospira mobilis]